MQPLDTAQQFYGLGVASIPLHRREKTPTLLSWRPYQTQLPTPGDLLRWFEQPDAHNIGIVTGWQGLVVLDFDERETYRRWLWWARRSGRFSLAAKVAQSAYRVSTSRGVHVYVWVTTPEKNRKLPGIDVKARNGYVLGEGSIHPSGAQYRALQPGLIIPRVAVLSDVLPAAILLQDAPPIPSATVVRTTLSNDPWAVVDQTTSITGHLVESIKKQLRIEDFVSATEQTSMDGRWRRCQCLLHDDDDPSMWIDTRDQLCGCFAGCTQKPLDVINLYARLHGLSNREAIFALAKGLP